MKLRGSVPWLCLALSFLACETPPATTDGGGTGGGVATDAGGGGSGGGGVAGTGGGGTGGTGGGAAGTGGGGTAGTGGGTAGGGGSGGGNADAGARDGTPCQASPECAGGFCGPATDGGRVCSSPCADSAACGGADLFRCSADDAGINRCWPRLATLCRPCNVDDDCRSDPRDVGTSARCVTPTDGTRGSFCSVSCATQSCPLGYVCEQTVRGPMCAKATGDCACAPAFEGTQTSCQQRNGIGTCLGTRSCTGGSLTACSARVPALETCNGVDDDCDGTPDEGTAPQCDDGLACTTDTCGGDAGCVHAVPGDECAVGGVCYAPDAGEPAGACATCQPGVSRTAFSAIDGCSVDGVCWPPDAGSPMTTCDVCDPSRSRTAFSPRLDNCVIDGGCYFAGAVNPDLVCQRCTPAVNRFDWTTVGTACLLDGGCFALGAPLPNDPCTVCSPSDAGPWNPGSGRVCDGGDACFFPALCDAGTCPPRVLRTDGNEPNNTSATATSLGGATRCDSTAAGGSGIVSGATDVDWYVASYGDTGFGCVLDPALNVTTGGASVRACAFVQCVSGTPSVSCGSGSSNTASSDGPGCCRTGPNPSFTYSFSCNCGTFCFDNRATVRARLDQFSGLACAPVNLSLKF